MLSYCTTVLHHGLTIVPTFSFSTQVLNSPKIIYTEGKNNNNDNDDDNRVTSGNTN